MNVERIKAGIRWLAIDDKALPVREDLCLYISKPKVRAAPVLTPAPRRSCAPDNLAAFFYGTVIEDPGPFGGRFRMWYHACHWPMNPDWAPDIARQFAKYDYPNMVMGPVCYAESADGINWFKPALNQVGFYGSRENNAVDLPHGVTVHVNVIKDEDAPNPSRRYKMVYQACPRFSDPPLEDAGPVSTVATAVSGDGLRWTPTGVPYPGQFMEMSGFYKFDGKYIVNAHTIASGGQGTYRTEGGHNTGRTGIARFSYDFDHWAPGFGDSFSLPQPRDPTARGAKGDYDQVHLGVAAADAGGVCVGLYGLWRGATEIHDATCHFGLVVSNDGLVFREPAMGQVFLDYRDSPARPHPERQFHTNLCQGNGILNVGDETRIYHGRWRNTGFYHLDKYYSEIALATLPRDRWGAFGIYPDFAEGTVWTMPARVGGADFTLNAEGASGIRVELADEKFNLLPEFSGRNAGQPAADEGLDVAMKWPEKSPRSLGDRAVRMKFTLRPEGGREPRLFAINWE